LTEQGRVFSWGYAEDGQLGHGNSEDCLTPKEIDYFKQTS